VVAPAAGAVVLVRFPFSDLSQVKLRAVVLADADRGDRILCQITSNEYGDPRAIQLPPTAFASGSLHVVSYVRPCKLFTASADLMIRQVAVMKPEIFQTVIDTIVNVLRGG
jgi:mRNA interferase MazF